MYLFKASLKIHSIHCLIINNSLLLNQNNQKPYKNCISNTIQVPRMTDPPK